MNSYKIALIIEEMDQSYQSSILNGIAAAASEFSLNISVFVSFSGSINQAHAKGEFNIFNLPDFNDFDGAILLTNTVARQSVIDDILNRIKAAGIPAVSIDNDIPYLYHVGIDNKAAMRRITEHLINVHDHRRFAYISGPADNPESADRLAAFLEVLEENNIAISDDYIFYGDFRAPSGREAVKHFLSLGRELPDAIICANDVMASSAICGLTDEGINVPKDIAVTGFDNTYTTQNYQVELTSVDRPLALSGRIACKMLSNHFNNIEQERSVILNMSPRFTESCGCSENVTSTVEDFKEQNYHTYMRLETSQVFMADTNKLLVELLGTDSFDNYIDLLKAFSAKIGAEEFYFCLCENWLSESDIDSAVSSLPEKTKSVTDYSDDIFVPIVYSNGKFYDAVKIKRRDILPEIANNGRTGKLYYHIPLHFGDRCFGYMVIYNSPMPLHNSLFESFCISLSNTLENMRKVISLEYAVERLKRLYARDTFSGIYNRNGFIQATDQLYRSCVEQQRNIMLMFIDLDGLKHINDTYGHSVGDKAICCVADVLVMACTHGEVYCRFGGDEFIVFAADASEAEADALTKRIEDYIGEVNKSGKHPFKLSASTGYFITKPQKGEDIFNFVTEADKVMYTEKKKKKLSKYLKA